MMRVTWTQPEDLLRHELWQSAAEGRDVSSQRARWLAAGGRDDPPSAGASAEIGTADQVALASTLLAELDALPETGAAREPSDWLAIAELIDGQVLNPSTLRQAQGRPSSGNRGDDAENGAQNGAPSTSSANRGADAEDGAQNGAEDGALSPSKGNQLDPSTSSGNRGDEAQNGAPSTLRQAQGRPSSGRCLSPSKGNYSADLANRIRGAWLGRAVGCVLGKPVEKIPRRGIEEILRSTGRWPLDRWFTAVGLDPEVAQRWPWNKASGPTSLEENIAGTPEDDDLNYTLMALRVLEQHGADFTPADVAQGWLLDLPAGRTFTAERVAYRNLLEAVPPPLSARIRNPFREWIGAQIRTDLYGWVNPGDPRTAAEWAWRDASVSHTRNGLYGAMFVAAMASAAVVADDIATVLDAGTSVVPPQSRMAEAIALGRRLSAEATEPTEAYAALEDAYRGMHWVHALNNTALVVYALASTEGRFDDAICRVVMGGWDTDSNGATVGAVTGALHGQVAIADRWAGPLQNRLSSSIPGCDGQSFDDVSARTLALIDRDVDA